MTRVFTADGNHVPVTVLQLENLTVIAHRTKEKDGYDALQLGAGAPKVKRMNDVVAGDCFPEPIEGGDMDQSERISSAPFRIRRPYRKEHKGGLSCQERSS